MAQTRVHGVAIGLGGASIARKVAMGVVSSKVFAQRLLRG